MKAWPVLILSALGSTALAQEATVSTGAFLTVGIGYIDVDLIDDDADPDLNEVFLVRDGELNFVFELTADSGVLFGIETQIEMADDGDFVDENYAYVAGDFGRFEIGEADGAGDTFSLAGITSYVFTSATDATGLLFDYYSGEAGFVRDASGENTSDALKITYYTPIFGGLQAGLSFAPSIESQNGTATDLTDETNAIELGGQYEGDFGDLALRVGAGYTSDTVAGEDDDQSIGGGARLAWGGFEAGVNWAWNQGFADFDDQNILGLGVAYATGPWLADASAIVVVDGPAEDSYGLAAELTYALAPGVIIGGVVEYGDREPVEPAQEDPDGSFATGLFLGLNF